MKSIYEEINNGCNGIDVNTTKLINKRIETKVEFSLIHDIRITIFHFINAQIKFKLKDELL